MNAVNQNNQNENVPTQNSKLQGDHEDIVKDQHTTRLSSSSKLDIDIVSDLICPWCFIGKRRLEKAITMLNDDDYGTEHYNVRIAWHPFELNPNMPKEGTDRKNYRTAKFGSWEASRALDEHVIAVGLAEDIPFAFDRIKCTPNTLDAHRLIWLAQKEGRQDSIVDALYQGYFVQGLDIGRRRVLVDIANAKGLDVKLVESFLNSNNGIKEVHTGESKAHQIGINAVPHFIINGKYTISGAQDTKILVSYLKKAIDAARVPLQQ
ncbi:MAG: DsbA family oxidoreductase [Candidatus Nitrosopolaris sp.]